ncbi:MAG: nitroreductase family protein [Desulfurococcaceae archaeon]
MGSKEYTEFLLTRRSIRKYKKDLVPLELLLEVVNVARFAPSARNLQPWEFIIITDPVVKDRLAAIYPWRQPLYDAPAGIVVVCDEKTSPLSYMVDCANAIIYIMLAAHAYGLGTVWLGVMRDEERSKIREILGLPNEKVPVAIIAIGWPDERPEPRPRKPLTDIVHINRYGNRLGQ